MKRCLESPVDQAVLLIPQEIWEVIISICYKENNKSLLNIVQANKWFYKLVDVKWHAEIDELREEVFIARLNVKYSALNEWFICDDCGKLYRSDCYHADIDVDVNIEGMTICAYCIVTCGYCDETFIASSGDKHNQCGQDVYENKLFEYSSCHHSDEDL